MGATRATRRRGRPAASLLALCLLRPPPGAAGAPTVVRLGGTSSLTGRHARASRDSLRGLQLFAEATNSSGAFRAPGGAPLSTLCWFLSSFILSTSRIPPGRVSRHSLGGGRESEKHINAQLHRVTQLHSCTVVQSCVHLFICSLADCVTRFRAQGLGHSGLKLGEVGSNLGSNWFQVGSKLGSRRAPTQCKTTIKSQDLGFSKGRRK